MQWQRHHCIPYQQLSALSGTPDRGTHAAAVHHERMPGPCGGGSSCTLTHEAATACVRSETGTIVAIKQRCCVVSDRSAIRRRVTPRACVCMCVCAFVKFGVLIGDGSCYQQRREGPQGLVHHGASRCNTHSPSLWPLSSTSGRVKHKRSAMRAGPACQNSTACGMMMYLQANGQAHVTNHPREGRR